MPLDLITQNQCSLCTTAIAAGATTPRPKTLCRHMVDPEGRLLYQLTTMKKWSFEQAGETMDAYCEFLTLKISEEDYKPKMLSPTDVIDQVWHAHILDTEAYQSFNERFVVDENTIHHDPLMAVDQETRHERCINTIKAYEQYFGKPFPKDCKAWMYDDLTAFTVEYPMSNGGGKWVRTTKENVMVRKTALVSDVCRQLGILEWQQLKALLPNTNEQRDVTSTSVSEFVSTKKIAILHPSEVMGTTSRSLGTISIRDGRYDVSSFRVDFERIKFRHIAEVYAQRGKVFS